MSYGFVLLACIAACGGLLESSEPQSTVDRPDASPVVRDASTDTTSPSTLVCVDDGGDHVFDRLETADASAVVMKGRCAAIVLDGKPCALEPGDASLSFGLDGHGWVVTASCERRITLTIAGVDDAPYPQIATTTFRDQPSARLKDGDLWSTTLGTSTIERGPQSVKGDLTVSTIAGSAVVVSSTGDTKRNVQFAFAF